MVDAKASTEHDWNRFLAAEIPFQKGRSLLAAIDLSISGWSIPLLARLDLTDSARRRIELASQAKIPEGLRFMTTDQLPPHLQNDDHAPGVLAVWGDPACLQQPTVAIVGTRSASTYGKVCAGKFAEDFARAGITVISGGAMGIDGAAHAGALSVRHGKTAAVLGCGVDVVYPPRHGALFEQIRSQGGALVSQYAMGQPPQEHHFLQRNQMIAMLAQAVVIIEAPPKSGALNTASHAADIGRDVFVVPGPIDTRGFLGSHALIRDGATLVNHPNQVIEALGLSPSASVPVNPPEGLAGQILGVLSAQAMSPEAICEQTGLESHVVLSELTILELDGLVIRDGGSYAKKS